MASKRAFAVGDRVAVRYPTGHWHGNPPQGFKATIQKHIARVLAVSGDVVLVEWEKPMVGRNTFLASACRRLIRRKRARRRVWIRKEILHEISLLVGNKLGVTCVDRADSPEWIEFREVRKAKERP